MSNQQFPLLLQYARRQSDLLEAMEMVRSGVQNSSIRNVHYQRAKEVIGRAFENAWRKHVYEPHVLESMRRGGTDDPVREEIAWTSIMSLHDAIAAHKRVSKLDPTHPGAAAAAQILNEAHPLACTMRDLKAHIVKGRVVSEAPARPENPNKVIGTCSCCFRGIAVMQTSGSMAHHGYTRPQPGLQSASCPGIKFKPLEVSTEGLEWLLRYSRDRLNSAQAKLAEAPNMTKVTERSRQRGAPPVVTTINDPSWPIVHKKYIANCESQVRHAQSTIEMLSKELDRWQAYHAEKDARPKQARQRQR